MSKILDDLIKLAEKISKNENLSPEDRDNDIDFIIKNIGQFPKYFNAVIMTETQISILRFKYDREDYLDKTQAADQSRRDYHINATHSINKINRAARRYGLDAIFKYDGYETRELKPEPEIKGVRVMEDAAKEDRKIAADLVYVFCKDVFLDAKTREKYNEKQEYTREEREAELYRIGKNDDHFNTETTLDELIEKASHFNESKQEKDTIESEYDKDVEI